MKASRLASAIVASAIGLVSLNVCAEGVSPPAAVGPNAYVDGVPPPKDVAYPGTLQISVDATDLAHRIFRVHEVVPAQAGPLTLLYPEWIPGDHEPSGPIDKFAGLVVKANGKVIPWVRDPLNVYAFHVDVPQGASNVEVDFQFLSPQNTREGRVVMTPEMLNLEWNANTLYPAGYYSRDIKVDSSVTFPAGWQFGTALETASRDGDTVHFKTTTFNTLIDSPIYAGKYFKRLDLDPGAAAPVHMDIVADEAKDLDVKPEQVQQLRNLVQQMYKLYGAHHYSHYDFLVSLSDKMSGNGLEHHQSSEDGTGADYFTDFKKNALEADLFSHEFNHSWDGKYRRPADLWTPNFNVPMQDSLLWVYEGQTQFWGQVMASRSGAWNNEQTLDMWAALAATYDKGRPGLATWRNVQDTTNDPIIAQRAPLPYRNYQGSEDYYSAGQLIWLDVDGKLRDLSHGKKSIDDFAKAFFGMDNGSFVTNTYTFGDVVKTLNDIQPYDWAKYLRDRLDGHGPLIGGIESHGWKLVYTDQPSAAVKAMEARRHFANLTYSLGLAVGKGGQIADVLWDSPAFKAGLSPAMTIVAVNGSEFDPDALKDAVTAAKGNSQPIQLLVKNFDQYKTVNIDYHDGLKYPHLVRDTSKPDTLSVLFKAR